MGFWLSMLFDVPTIIGVFAITIRAIVKDRMAGQSRYRIGTTL